MQENTLRLIHEAVLNCLGLFNKNGKPQAAILGMSIELCKQKLMSLENVIELEYE